MLHDHHRFQIAKALDPLERAMAFLPTNSPVMSEPSDTKKAALQSTAEECDARDLVYFETNASVTSPTNPNALRRPDHLDTTSMPQPATENSALDHGTSENLKNNITDTPAHLIATYQGVEVSDITISTTQDLTSKLAFAHLDLVNLVERHDPNDHIPVRAADLKAILDRIRQLENSIAATKKETPKLVSFTLFPKLPLELRRTVWHHALHVPETFTLNKNIDFYWTEEEDSEEGEYVRRFKVTRSTSKSNIRLVHHEARNEAKRVLVQCSKDTPAASNSSKWRDRQCIYGNNTWFNASTDTAWFSDSSFSSNSAHAFPRNHYIESIAIRYHDWKIKSGRGAYSDFHYRRNYGWRWRRLREIVIIVGHSELRIKHGNETVTAASKPDDFRLHETKDVPILGFTWEMMGLEEMRQMEEDRTQAIAYNQRKKDGKLTDEDIYKETYRGNWKSKLADITVPIITFRLEIETLV
ncbi:hypothetical protein VTL71DRAFT_8909 [Oculimacula yallundae]|uniref:2EXR domain-containing protein n=1 Tax=Oculimacula yallundae TaxID=86028 RepID=A0ABR4BU13_9HELO